LWAGPAIWLLSTNHFGCRQTTRRPPGPAGNGKKPNWSAVSGISPRCAASEEIEIAFAADGLLAANDADHHVDVRIEPDRSWPYRHVAAVDVGRSEVDGLARLRIADESLPTQPPHQLERTQAGVVAKRRPPNRRLACQILAVRRNAADLFLREPIHRARVRIAPSLSHGIAPGAPEPRQPAKARRGEQ
jgi:hypothetical protein